MQTLEPNTPAEPAISSRAVPIAQEAPDRPVLSVVVVIVSDTMARSAGTSHLAKNLAALTHQVDAPPMEVIVPYHPNTVGMDRLKADFAGVTFEEVGDLRTYTGKGGSREHHDELRARGLNVARGQIVALLEDHAVPDARWCASIVRAHQTTFAEYAAVGGPLENGVDRPLNWAVYFCDFARYQDPVPEGPSLFASDANVSYKVSVLRAIAPVWRDVFHETAVNAALLARGEKIGLSRGVRVAQHRSDLRLAQALRERFIWGRSYAASRPTAVAPAARARHAAVTPLLPFALTFRVAASVLRKRRHVSELARALPLVVMLFAAWALGELAGYCAPARGDR